MMQYDTLLVETTPNGILKIMLNRPEKLNALNETVFSELDKIFEYAKTTDNVKALLITGQGKAFCAGADIHRLAELNAIQGKIFSEQGQETFRQLETLGKPSLAAINGYAFGGGCEFAMAATLRIASYKAQFGQPEVKLGLIPGYGGTQRLARLVGKGRALDLCLTGRFIDANEALAWGLISKVVAEEKLEQAAMEILDVILSMAPLAVKSVMDVVDKGYDLTLEDALHLEAMHFGLLCATGDKARGVEAFLNKQSPKFLGE